VHVIHANDLHIRHQVDVSDTRELCNLQDQEASAFLHKAIKTILLHLSLKGDHPA